MNSSFGLLLIIHMVLSLIEIGIDLLLFFVMHVLIMIFLEFTDHIMAVVPLILQFSCMVFFMSANNGFPVLLFIIFFMMNFLLKMKKLIQFMIMLIKRIS